MLMLETAMAVWIQILSLLLMRDQSHQIRLIPHVSMVSNCKTVNVRYKIQA
jgi:hypothetical protein